MSPGLRRLLECNPDTGTTRRAVIAAGLGAGALQALPPAPGEAKSTWTRVPMEPVYTSPGPVRLGFPNSAGATANPYPSAMVVDALVDPTMAGYRVVLRGLTHPEPKRLIFALETPSGAWAYLMFGAGGTIPVSGIDLEFMGSITYPDLPQPGPLVSGQYQSRCYGVDYTLPKPGPQTTGAYTCGYSAELTTSTPLGVWTLWVHDTAGTYQGQILSSWELRLSVVASVQTKRKKKKKKKHKKH